MRIGTRIGLALAMTVLLVAGCCNNPTQYHYPISQTMLDLSPYNAGSIFHLRNSTGAIVRMSVLSENRSEFKVNPCDNCCAEEYRDQYFIYFQSDSAGLQMQIQISQEGQEGVYDPTRLEVNLGPTGVFYADFQNSAACQPQTTLSCLDTMVVAGRPYTHVFDFKNQSTNHADGTPSHLYYSPEAGLISYTTYGGNFWELVQ